MGKVVLAYAVVATLWILLSDWLVELLYLSPRLEVWAQTLKGLVFVGITAILLWVVLSRLWEAQTEVETRLWQSQRLESIGRLAGGVAHDFNNLLTAISGYSVLLLGRSDLDASARGDVGEIKKAAESAAVLTRQLLAFGRQQPMQMRVLDLNEVVSELDGVLRRVIRENIEVVFKPADDLGNVKADPGQLEQVLMNLAINASDAMPDGGRLTIETGNVALDDESVAAYESARPGPHVLLAVSDTGTGMDEETAGRAFEPYFTTKKKEGTGLGLASVYGIVKQHHGVIWLYTEPEEGTTFKIYLPRVDAPAERFHRTAPGEMEACGSGTILLVEDEEEVRIVAARILRRLGYEVLAAEHAAHGRELAAAHGSDIDLLVTDVVMPGQNGMEFAEELRRDLPSLKVLFMSGYTEETAAGTRMPTREMFLPKPFTPREFGAKVRKAMAQGAPAGSLPTRS